MPPTVRFVNRFFHPDTSGTARMLTDLAEDLARAGFGVSVVASDGAAMDPAARFPRDETWAGIAIRRVRAGRFNRQSVLGWALNALLFYPGALGALLRGPQPDVTVYLTDPPLLFALGPLVRWWRGGRCVVWSQDVYPDLAVELSVLGRRSPLTALWRWLAGQALRRADAVVAIGETMADRLAAKGVRPDRIAIIHNWTDGARVAPVAADDNPFRARHGLTGKFVVGYSGNFGLSHEFATLVGAAGRLRAREDVLFLFIGDGKQARNVRAAAGHARARFLPFQPEAELAQSLSAPDVHVVSLRNGLAGLLLPSKLYGALAAGRPVIYVGPADAEPAAILAAGKCGTRVAPGDVAGLVAAIESLRDGPAARARMGARAREVFAATYDRPLATARWADALRHLV